MRYVVVGASAAGLAAAEGILEVDPGADVLLLSDEPHAPYCRPLISYWLARETPATLFSLPCPALERVEFRTGERAVALDADARRLTLDGGEVVPFDRLCVATGAQSRPLGLDGEACANVYGFRTRDDADALDAELLRGAERAIVLGGGLVGVKAAHALAARGVATSLWAASGFLLSQAVDETAGLLVARALEAEGVRVHVGCRPVALRIAGGRVTGVRFEPPGELEPCDLVVRGKGVTPRGELLGGEGADGVLADPELRSALPEVWVAGDVALTQDVAWNVPRLNAIWPAAVEQGRLAGRNMAGARETYGGSLAMNSLRLGPLHLVSAGITRPPPGPFRVLKDEDLARGYYRRVVLREGRLVGAVFAGETEGAGMLVTAIRVGARLEDLPFHPLERRPQWGAYAFSGVDGRRVGIPPYEPIPQRR
jgi:NAD(P)H-nitrite reductase large subunit